MSDHDEIMNALGRYARGVDERDFASVAALFTSDADIDYSVGGGAVASPCLTTSEPAFYSERP